MPRPAKFTEDQILDAALELVAEGGPAAATMAAIAARAGAPVGSLYHRFRSREWLLARLWLRTVERFQRGFADSLRGDDLDEAAQRAARFGLTFVRQRPAEARVLLLYRRQDLAARWPDEIGEQLAGLNRRGEQAMREHARLRYGSDDDEHLQRVVFALADLPYAASRRHLAAGRPPPPILDVLVADAVRSVLGVRDDRPAGRIEGAGGP